MRFEESSSPGVLILNRTGDNSVMKLLFLLGRTALSSVNPTARDCTAQSLLTEGHRRAKTAAG